MATLGIDLQDGFSDDTVVVRIDGTEVFRKDDVTTKLLLGFAETISVPVETGPVNVEVAVETRGISETIPLDVQNDTYLGLSITDDMIQHIRRDEPFPYG